LLQLLDLLTKALLWLLLAVTPLAAYPLLWLLDRLSKTLLRLLIPLLKLPLVFELSQGLL
jgi:hypothetical protein